MHPQMIRLYEAVAESRGIRTQSDLARALNTSPQKINNWESRGISKAGLVASQEVLGISATWLESGREPRFVATQGNVAPSTIGNRRIPLISYVQAGDWTGVVDTYQPNDAEEWLLTDAELSSSSFALEIKGDSMLPEFKPGDRVIIDPEINPAPGDFVVAKNGDEATFKKYRPRGISDQGTMIFELVPLNEDYPSMRSDIVPIRIVGTMVEHRKYRRR